MTTQLKTKPARKWLYIMKDPFGGPDLKIGITQNLDSRLGLYQNSYSSRSYVARFNYVWTGPADQIDRLEKVCLHHFTKHIELDGSGHSEWLFDVDYTTVIEEIQKLISDYAYDITSI